MSVTEKYILSKILEIEEKMNVYIKTKAKTIENLKRKLEAVRTSKYKVGEAVFSSKSGNVVVTDIKIDASDRILYCAVGVLGEKSFYEEDLLPITQATKTLFEG